MNRFEFMLNLDNYRNAKPKNVLLHDSYDIPEQKIHRIQSDYSRAPKSYKDQISLYEEYNEESLCHGGNYKYYQKIDNYYGPGKARYFQTKEEWDAYQREKEKIIDNAKKDVAERDKKIATQHSKNLFDMKIKKTKKSDLLPNIKEAVRDVVRYDLERFDNPIVEIPIAEKYDELDQEWGDLNNKQLRKVLKKSSDIIDEVMQKHGYKNQDDYEKAIEEKYKHLTNPDGVDDKSTPEFKEAFKEIIDEVKVFNKEFEDAFQEEYDKAIKADKAYTKYYKAAEAFEDLYDNEYRQLSKSDKYLLLEELGMDDFSDAELIRKMGYDANFDPEKAIMNSDDYGAEIMGELTTKFTEFIKEFKKAKKAINDYSKSEDEDDD